ncbi:hypothetical protein EFY87_14040 [Flexivirga caeni]|uniref:Uncharacterized protein n=1 Tax=Flexivirga caeni TaxID=2294115 RepID=A0A3M9M567_9MICO|nr:hypothetical protein EFY87_14040 [Flexivirga caeni]
MDAYAAPTKTQRIYSGDQRILAGGKDFPMPMLDVLSYDYDYLVNPEIGSSRASANHGPASLLGRLSTAR